MKASILNKFLISIFVIVTLTSAVTLAVCKTEECRIAVTVARAQDRLWAFGDPFALSIWQVNLKYMQVETLHDNCAKFKYFSEEITDYNAFVSSSLSKIHNGALSEKEKSLLVPTVSNLDYCASYHPPQIVSLTGFQQSDVDKIGYDMGQILRDQSEKISQTVTNLQNF